MTELFTERYMLLWAAVLAVALFFPVRRLIWVLMMRRATRTAELDDAEQGRLKKRAGFTAALLVFVFSYFYTRFLFSG